ncbi:MAG: 50S ribosomal protein L28 [Phycisphaeraceae bacterium]|nr:50S ribosomal protein L28 [Phycisphaeraceae bacterium]
MSRVCKFTGRRTSAGNTYTHRGKAKYLGGVGTKVTGKTRRKFRPNIQTVTALVDGVPQRIKVSTKAIRMGLVVKPAKRKYVYNQQSSDDQAGAAGA